MKHTSLLYSNDSFALQTTDLKDSVYYSTGFISVTFTLDFINTFLTAKLMLPGNVSIKLEDF